MSGNTEWLRPRLAPEPEPDGGPGLRSALDALARSWREQGGKFRAQCADQLDEVLRGRWSR